MSGQAAGRTRFDVWPTPVGAEDLGALRGDVEEAAIEAIKQLRSSGCRAAAYRLEGDPLLERICVRRLPRNHRMVLAFPAEDQVVVLLVGQRLSRTRGTQLDAYVRLYRALNLKVALEEGRRPPCCDDGQPPIDPDLVERFIERSRELTRGKRRHRGTSQR